MPHGPSRPWTFPESPYHGGASSRFLMKAFGGNPTTEEVEAHLKTVDIDGDGTVDYPEFLSEYNT